MLFKPIDPAFVLSDTFRNWPLETKATFTVCAALGNYLTGEFHHATATIANHANLSTRAVRRSLKRMEAADQLTINGTRKRSFIYNFAAAVTAWLREQKEKKYREVEATVAESDGQQTLDLTVTYRTGESVHRTGESVNESGIPGEIPPQTPVIPDENQGRHNPCSLFLTTEELTTTAQAAAEVVPDALVEQMVTRHGKEDVVVTLSAMRNMMQINPDCFSNPPAYFRRCCENGWIPTNKDIQDREKKQKMDEAARRRQEELNTEFQSMKENAAACDPLVAQKAMAEINAMLTDVPAA